MIKIRRTMKKWSVKNQRNIFKKVLTNYDLIYIITIAFAPLAQLVEHLTLNQGVQGSSP